MRTLSRLPYYTDFQVLISWFFTRSPTLNCFSCQLPTASDLILIPITLIGCSVWTNHSLSNPYWCFYPRNHLCTLLVNRFVASNQKLCFTERFICMIESSLFHWVRLLAHFLWADSLYWNTLWSWQMEDLWFCFKFLYI